MKLNYSYDGDDVGYEPTSQELEEAIKQEIIYVTISRDEKLSEETKQLIADKVYLFVAENYDIEELAEMYKEDLQDYFKDFAIEEFKEHQAKKLWESENMGEIE